jgi:hypothetical protein
VLELIVARWIVIVVVWIVAVAMPVLAVVGKSGIRNE